MIVPVTESMFIDYFRGSDQWRNHFSYSACQKIFELINDDEENDNVEFCHHSITEEWAEYESVFEYLEDITPDHPVMRRLMKERYDDVVWYDIEKWDWDKDGNKLVTKSVLINKYQSE